MLKVAKPQSHGHFSCAPCLPVPCCRYKRTHRLTGAKLVARGVTLAVQRRGSTAAAGVGGALPALLRAPAEQRGKQGGTVKRSRELQCQSTWMAPEPNSLAVPIIGADVAWRQALRVARAAILVVADFLCAE